MPGQSAMPAAGASSAAVRVLSTCLGDVPPGGKAGGTLPGLAGFLAAVPDHRRAQGRRHSLACILGLACAATAAGAKSLVAIAEWAADAPAAVLAALGVRHDPCGGAQVVPSETTIRRALAGTDPGALDEQLAAWLAAATAGEADEQAPCRVMVDGKTMRGAVQADGRAVHLLAAMSGGGAVLAQREVGHKTNEVRREALCRIPDSVRRNSEGCSWTRWLTRIRKVRGTRACHGNLRSCPKTRNGAQGGPRDMAKAELPESQSPVMQVFIHRKRSLKPVPRSASCYLVGDATSGVAGDAQ
jgi:hypothetical protein